MKKEPKHSLLFLGPVYFVIILATIILLSLQKWAYSVIVVLPTLFLYPIWLTFIKSRDYQGKKKATHYLLRFLRYLLVILAILIPALLYSYVPFFFSALQGFSLLIPPSEVLILYRLIIPETLMIEKTK